MLLRKFSLTLFSAALAATAFTAGCRGHHDHRDHDDDQPAQAQPAAPAPAPAPSETVVYNQWEVDTHRPHKELAQRTAEEQKEYRDWHQQHPNGR